MLSFFSDYVPRHITIHLITLFRNPNGRAGLFIIYWEESYYQNTKSTKYMSRCHVHLITCPADPIILTLYVCPWLLLDLCRIIIWKNKKSVNASCCKFAFCWREINFEIHLRKLTLFCTTLYNVILAHQLNAAFSNPARCRVIRIAVVHDVYQFTINRLQDPGRKRSLENCQRRYHSVHWTEDFVFTYDFVNISEIHSKR